MYTINSTTTPQYHGGGGGGGGGWRGGGGELTSSPTQGVLNTLLPFRKPHTAPYRGNGVLCPQGLGQAYPRPTTEGSGVESPGEVPVKG